MQQEEDERVSLVERVKRDEIVVFQPQLYLKCKHSGKV